MHTLERLIAVFRELCDRDSRVSCHWTRPSTALLHQCTRSLRLGGPILRLLELRPRNTHLKAHEGRRVHVAFWRTGPVRLPSSRNLLTPLRHQHRAAHHETGTVSAASVVLQSACEVVIFDRKSAAAPCARCSKLRYSVSLSSAQCKCVS